MTARWPLVALVALVAIAAAACGRPPAPEPLDTRHDNCASCRMTVSDRHLAAQIVASGDEPKFFDDLGCLSQYLATQPIASDAAVFVADHRTGDWVPAERAVFSRLTLRSTPMASGLVAHESTASRAADAAAAASTIVPAAAVLGKFANRTEHAL